MAPSFHSERVDNMRYTQSKGQASADYMRITKSKGQASADHTRMRSEYVICTSG